MRLSNYKSNLFKISRLNALIKNEKAPAGELLRLNTLRGNKTTFVTPSPFFYLFENSHNIVVPEDQIPSKDIELL